MAEYINGYLDSNLTQQISEAGAMTNPIEITIDTTNGDTYELPIWLKNVATAAKLTNIQVSTANVPSDSPLTFSFALDNSGVPGTYASVISLPDMNPNDVVKIWWKIEAPADTVLEYTAIKVNIAYQVQPL